MSALSSSAVTIEDGEVTIAAHLLAQKLGLSVEALKAEMRRGYVYSLGEQGISEDAGRTRLPFRYRAGSWTVVDQPDGTLIETSTEHQGIASHRDRASLVQSSEQRNMTSWRRMCRDQRRWRRLFGFRRIDSISSQGGSLMRLVIEHADAKVHGRFPVGLRYRPASQIDDVDDLMSASFKIKNPKQTAACGSARASRSVAKAKILHGRRLLFES